MNHFANRARRALPLILLAAVFKCAPAIAADIPNKDSAFTALLPFINSAAKDDLQVRIDALDKAQRIKIISADAKALVVRMNGNEMPTPWKLIFPENIADIGRASIRTSVP